MTAVLGLDPRGLMRALVLLLWIAGLLFLYVRNWRASELEERPCTQRAWSQQQPHVPLVPRTAEEQDWRTGCPGPGVGVVITVVGTEGPQAPGGRFGNVVWEYLSVWSAARRFGVWPAVPRPVLDTLRPVFPSLSLPALEDVAARCNLSHLLTQYDRLKDTGNKEGLRAAIESQGGDVSLVVWPRYSVDRRVVVPFWRELRDQLTFSHQLQVEAQEVLRDAANLVRRRATLAGSTWPPHESPEYVGVHVRRTDFSAYLQRRFPGSQPADENFFLRAMENMRAQLPGRRLVMVVVSDDVAWCRKRLRGPDVVVAGNGDVARPARDLAVLAGCNHSVFAYGTFALSAAVQHPDGIAIVYDPQPSGGEEHVGLALAKQLPRWSVLRNQEIVKGH